MAFDRRMTNRVSFLLMVFALWATTAQAQLTGRVVGVTDGDTITILTADNEQIKIRLAEIDTPERGQPYFQRAKEKLSQLVFNKTVYIEVETKDRYGRTVGRVYVRNTDVCAEMVESGLAWVYRKYATDEELYDLEDDARAAERGIWSLSDSERQPPWEWRRTKKTKKKKP